MPKISNSPTARTFADALVEEMQPEVAKAAGSDCILTRAEAATIPTKIIRDAAQSYFERTEKTEVEVNTLLGAVQQYAWREAKNVVGGSGANHRETDKRLSADDATRLPADLKAGYDYLKSLPGPAAD